MVDGKTYSAEGKVPAKCLLEQCAMSLLKEVHGIDVPFTPYLKLFSEEKFSNQKFKRPFFHMDKVDGEDDLTYKASITIDGTKYDAEGRDFDDAKNNCAKKILKQKHGIEC